MQNSLSTSLSLPLSLPPTLAYFLWFFALFVTFLQRKKGNDGREKEKNAILCNRIENAQHDDYIFSLGSDKKMLTRQFGLSNSFIEIYLWKFVMQI